jgi:hypothetical protein
MRVRLLAGVLLIASFGFLVQVARAVTHTPVEVVCPICQTKNTLQTWMSWETYVYLWPSRFQMTFFPYTDPISVYHCTRCHFSAFEWDFADPPEEKRAAIQEVLRSVRCSSHSDEYLKMPASDRLAIAEKVYRLLDKDEEFWCHFQRVKGYHLQEEGRKAEASAERRQALDVAQRMLGRPDLESRRKETLVVIAAMHHYLGSDPEALRALREASSLTYSNPQAKAEENEGCDAYLSRLIEDYIKAIQEGPNTDEEYSSPADDE